MSGERTRTRFRPDRLGLLAALGMTCTLVAFGQQRGQVEAGLDGAATAAWHTQGTATWRVDKGEIVGTVGPDGAGGWLVSNRSYQHLGVTFAFRCTGPCQPGIQLGREKAGDRVKGLYISLAEGDLRAYAITSDAQGREVERRAFESAGPSGRRSTSGPPPKPPYDMKAWQGTLPGLPGHPFSEPEATARVQKDGWNEVEVRLYTPVNAQANALHVIVNGIDASTGYPSPKIGPPLGQTDRIEARPETGQFGTFALRVAGSPGTEVRFRDPSIRNYTEIVPTPEKTSNRFRTQAVTRYFYGDGSAVGDLNRDGHIDVVAGPMYWLGPDFTRGRQIDVTYPLSPTDYGATLGCEVADFTGDGWPDVLLIGFPGGGPLWLYVNPKNELRLWERHRVVIENVSELYTLADIDRDGKPEFVYGGAGYAVNYATPDPADPTRPWIVHHLTQQAGWGAHGVGVGDINGDGRPDVMRAWGWWEQPPDPTQVPWKYHKAVLGRPEGGGPGGAQMEVYDVNGDGLNDIVTSLEAHGYGLAWFEQTRDAAGEISFVEHIIMDRDPSKSHGVIITQLHGLVLGDVDGDGLKDIITGAHKSNHGGHYTGGPDADSEGLFYWFKLVRQPGKPVEFVPQLIHNASGGGRQPRLLDLDADGVADIVNSGRFGTWLFFGKKGAAD